MLCFYCTSGPRIFFCLLSHLLLMTPRQLERTASGFGIRAGGAHFISFALLLSPNSYFPCHFSFRRGRVHPALNKPFSVILFQVVGSLCHLLPFLCFFLFLMWPLCFADEGRSAVDAAGGAQIVAEHIKALAESTDPAAGKLLTVFCGMLMNYSNDNGNDRSPKQEGNISEWSLIGMVWDVH